MRIFIDTADIDQVRRFLSWGICDGVTTNPSIMFKDGVYDAESGAVLWKFQAGAGVNAPPASYSVDGKQYIVVGAGGNSTIQSKPGNDIIAFTLD